MKEMLLRILKYCLANKTKIITSITSIVVLVSEVVAVINGTTLGTEVARMLSGG